MVATTTPPDPMTCRSASAFRERLMELRYWCGQPSLRQLRKLGGSTRAQNGDVVDALPPTTVSAVLRGRRAGGMPRLSFVEAFVTACLSYSGHRPEVIARELERWRHAWRALAVPDAAHRWSAPGVDWPGPPTYPNRSAARWPMPRQLPMGVMDFVGRRTELRWLDTWAGVSGQRPAPVVLITGRAGLGKTSLAIHWAHQAGVRFPDAHLFASLVDPDDGTAVDPAEVLASFLRALGIDDYPATTTERAALFRSALAVKRAIVLLDDAQSVSQVRPLLPGSGTCMALVTSRHGLSELVVHEGARRLELAPMNESDALQLVRTVSAVPPLGVCLSAGEATRLVAECGGSPLRIRAAVERLHRAVGV